MTINNFLGEEKSNLCNSKSSESIDEKRINLVTNISIALDESGYEWEMTYDPNEDVYYFKITNTRENQND